MKLQSALVFAKDLERMVAFYRDALGLALIERSEGWALFDAGGAQVALHAIPAAIAARIEIATPPRARADTALKLIFACDDLAAACAQIEAHGGALVQRADSACDALDPEGNVLRIAR